MSLEAQSDASKAKRAPFAAVPWRVIDAGLPPHDLAVYVAILRHADRSGRAFPSLTTIARVARVSQRFTQGAVMRLEAAGLLSVERQSNAPGHRASNAYVIAELGNTVPQSDDELRNTVPQTREYGSSELGNGIPSNKNQVTRTNNKRVRTRAKTFIPPTIEEVRDYAKSVNLSIDPEAFVDHYSSNGWKVGKHSMKDWQAAVRQWARRQGAFSGDRPQQAPAKRQAMAPIGERKETPCRTTRQNAR